MRIDSRERSFRALAWIFVIALLACSLALQGCTTKAETVGSSPGRPTKRGEGGGSVPVVVTKVVQKDVPIDIQVVGTVEAYLTVSVKAQVSGEITQVFFKEGDFVKKGEQLFAIDPRTYQAQFTQAQANLAKDEAVLAQLQANQGRDEAQQKYAESEAARYARLFENRLVPKEQSEQMRTNADAIAAALRADSAAILSARATIEATKASVENAKVLLSYTSIRSPLDGRTGNLDVKQGNVISPNTSLMTINQVEPIYVTFSVPEAQLKSVRKGLQVMASLQDDTAAPQVGQVTFIDNTVDSTTGTIRLKGTFRNSDHKLWPGQFVRVTLRLATQPNALIVPNQVVQSGQDGSFVFVVKPDQQDMDLSRLTGVVESRPVVSGARVDQDLVIEKGLALGEIVVTEGQLRLAPGSRVQVGGGGGRRSGPAGGQRGADSGRGRGQGKGADLP